MNDLFVDTSGWASWIDRGQTHHALASTFLTEAWNRGDRVVTTSLVLAELTALLTSPIRLSKPLQIAILTDLRSDPRVEVMFADTALDAAAWQLWGSRPDKDWTLVDCANFALMADRGLTRAITNDHHFEQAGFVRLLK